MWRFPKSWGVPLIFIYLTNITFSLRNQPAIGDPHFWKTPMALWWTSVTWPRSWGYNGGRNLPVCSWRFWHLGIWGIYRNLWFFSRKSLEIPWNPLKLPPPPGLPPPACHSPGGLTQWSPQTLMIRNVGECCPNQRLTSQLFNTCFWWLWWIPSGCFWCELIPLRKCCFANQINFKQKIENYSWPKFIRPNLYTHRSS